MSWDYVWEDRLVYRSLGVSTDRWLDDGCTGTWVMLKKEKQPANLFDITIDTSM